MRLTLLHSHPAATADPLRLRQRAGGVGLGVDAERLLAKEGGTAS